IRRGFTGHACRPHEKSGLGQTRRVTSSYSIPIWQQYLAAIGGAVISLNKVVRREYCKDREEQ
uniref:hypothetical protein n=1 Tax=Pseudomonas aeruginosa TaxID=287 RepID=UPI001E5CD22C